MGPRTIHLFADTNLFIQCRSLDELDWTLVAEEASEIYVVVSKPVQKEIDDHKNQGNQRLNKRARKASSLFRQMLRAGSLEKTIREHSPIVHLRLMPTLKPSDVFEELDYRDVDDRLVGIAGGYKLAHPDEHVRVLTDDTGPMATALSQEVSFVPIPESWLLEPEKTDAEKKIAALQAENDRLRMQEPVVELVCRDHVGTAIDRVDLEIVNYLPLTATEIDDLVDRLVERYPVLAVNTKSDGVLERMGTYMTEVFIPPTDEEVAQYQQIEYPAWIEQCREYLAKFHQRVQRDEPPPAIVFGARNVGSRPANDVLVSMSVHANAFPIRAIRGATRRAPSGVSRRFPRPPVAPSGSWRSSISFGIPDETFIALRNMSSLQDTVPVLSMLGPPRLPSPIDPNNFYLKEGSKKFNQRITYECKQWRHRTDEQQFRWEFERSLDRDDVSGLLVCRIEAENLSNAVELKVPVRLTVRRESCLSVARTLIADSTAFK
jgi:hypothetical protein